MGGTLLSNLTSPEARKALAEAIRALFKQWGLHDINQAELLGLKTMAAIAHGKPLPNNADVLTRAGHLLAIGRALNKAYAYNLSLGDT